MTTATPERRARRQAHLLELTQTPTAAGLEQRVHAWVERFLQPHASALDVVRDAAGNWLVLQRRRQAGKPLVLFTAHLDHPAFVVTACTGERTLELEFRGGVNDPYFVGAEIEVVATDDTRHAAVITTLDAQAKPFKKVTATLHAPAPQVQPGQLARWRFPRAEIIDGVLHTDACDDLAAAAAALCVFEELLEHPDAGNTGLLLTVAEEVGFIGAIHAARTHLVPHSAALICLENSRSFPHDSPIGAGAILRVGDRLSVFSPSLTNRLTQLFSEHQKKDPSFRYQRKLMAGGACEATAFASFGLESTCLCLPLGNYHNMVDIDGVAAGKAQAAVGREHISVEDFHSLCTMLHVAALHLDTASLEPFGQLMESLYAERAFVAGVAPGAHAGTAVRATV